MSATAWVLVIIAVLILVVLWLVSRAKRVDRLHRQVIQAHSTVDRLLSKRREILLRAEERVRRFDYEAAADIRDLLQSPAPGRPGHTTTSESAITRWLREDYFPKFGTNTEIGEISNQLATNAFELQAARRFYNQQVFQTQRLRSKPDVLVFRLAGHAEMPSTYDFDDQVK